MSAQSVGSVAGRFRSRGRIAVWASITACVALLATSIVLGTGAAGAKVSLADLGNWLTSSKANTVVHVNGTTGQVDGRVELPGQGQGPLQVGMDGSAVLVLDQGTGTVSRIDPAQLTVPQTRDYGADGLALAVGGGKAWLVDSRKGTVQPIDPVSLAPVSGPIDLGSRPLGPAGADNAGNLYVTLPAAGTVVTVKGSVPSAPIPVADPGHVLLLTVADGRPVVTDTTTGVVKVLGPNGPTRTINLPDAVAKAKPESVRVPQRSDGPFLPILATESGQLVLLNINDGAVQAAPVATAKNDYAAPVVLGSRVYVADRTAGELLVYDTAAAAFAPSVRVTGAPGPIEVDVRDGLLWANDQTKATAVVVDGRGNVHPVDKYKPGAPAEAEKTATASPSTRRPTRTESAPASPTGSPSGPTGGSSAPGTSGPPAGERTTPPPGAPPNPQPNPTRTSTPPTADPKPPVSVPPPVVVTTTKIVEVPAPPRPTTDAPQPPPLKTNPPQQPPATKTNPPAPPATSTRPATTTKPASPSPRPTTSAPGPGGPGGPPPSPSATPSTTPPPPPTKPPGTPKAESGPGRITLVFAASSGAQPDRYVIDNLPDGAKAAPGTVAPGGPFQFVITGLSCAKEYSFRVAAEFGTKREVSGDSTAVRPCVLVSAPTGLTAEVPRNGHGFTATWKAPANAGGSEVQYKVAWQGSGGGSTGSTTTKETKATATGLANGVQYNVTVTAVNEVGSGPAASTTVSLVAPSKTYNVGPNSANGVTVGIRTGPGVAGTRSVAQIPAGYEGAITVHCQTTGERVNRDDTSVYSNIWDKVTWQGHTGYTTDLYIRTPNSDSGTFSPELWQCE